MSGLTRIAPWASAALRDWMSLKDKGVTEEMRDLHCLLFPDVVKLDWGQTTLFASPLARATSTGRARTAPLGGRMAAHANRGG